MTVRPSFHLMSSGLIGCVSLLVLTTTAFGQVATAPAPPAFPERLSPPLVVPTFTDVDIVRLRRILTAQLAVEKDRARWGMAAQVPLWNFGRQLQAGYLTKTQEAGVMAYLDRLAAAHKEQAGALDGIRGMVRSQMPGKVAPDIVATDLNGKTMRLSDLRGRVVVLLFSAEWCGICHTLNPYERLLTELYGEWPFAIVSVETGETRESVKRSKAARDLSYQSWWDPPRPDAAGVLATNWNALGFPTIYVIDQAGVIRFVDVRYEDLLKAVKQVLNERPDQKAPALALNKPRIEVSRK